VEALNAMLKKIRNIDWPTIVALYSPRGWAVRIVVGLLVAALILFAVMRLPAVLHALIFGDPQSKIEHANAVVAREQTKAEANIATQTIEKVHEQDVYREHVTNVVHEAQEKVNEADHGQQMDPEIDAAVAAGLCKLNQQLCRQSPASPGDPPK
jgi:hypothetical protein